MDNYLKYLQLEDPILQFNEDEESSFFNLIDTIEKTDTWEFAEIPCITASCRDFENIKKSEGTLSSSSEEESTSAKEKADDKTTVLSESDENDEEKLSAEKNTRLTLTLNGNEYKVLPQAFHSIERRANDEAKVNDKLPLDIRARRLNEDFQFGYTKRGRPLNAKGLIRGGNLLALLSDRYVPFSQKQIFNTFTFTLESNFDRVDFRSSSYTHSLTEAVYDVYESELIEEYRELLEEVSHKYASEEIYLKMIISTTDIGVSSIAVLPLLCFEGHKENVPLNEPIKVQHRDTTVFRDVEKAFMSIFSITRNGLKHLPKLLKITIKRPTDCAYHIAKKLQLPMAEVEELIPQFAYYEASGTPLTAHDFFMIMSDILNSSKYYKLPPEKKVYVRDNLSKMVMFDKADWAKYDKPFFKK